MEIPATLRERLEAMGQSHLLRFWDELDESQQRELLGDLEEIDFELLSRLLAMAPAAVSDAANTQRIEHARSPERLVRPVPGGADPAEWQRAANAGAELLKNGRVGAILVAGGQGTRLGFDKPKGLFPIGPLSGKSLYQWFSEQLLARSRQLGPAIPYFIMTSDATHRETVAYFEEHDYFGMQPDNVFFFQQGTLPAAELDSPRLLLDQKNRLSLSPDGHGGLLKALDRHCLLEEMTTRRIEYLYYHQVDNPTASFCDPAFLGWHVLRDSELTTKVVAKATPEERMGVVCSVDDRTEIIEYSDLTPEQARLRNPDGGLRFWAGSTAIHVFSLSFLNRLLEDGIGLPYHVAVKAVPHIDESGARVTPPGPNARKFEQFIFDSLPLAHNALVVEADRAQEFNPVKNRDGADSPATARAALVANHRRWLENAGAVVAPGVTVEISPLFAVDEQQTAERMNAGTTFTQDTQLDDALG